jgi:hypothetical protein
MKPVHVQTVSCFKCSSNRLCCLCAPLWFRVKNRNYCPSCHQLKWTKALFDFSYVHIYEGIVENSHLFKEALAWPVFQKFVFAPTELSVGEFKGLYFGANLARFAGSASTWVVHTYIRPTPPCSCVTPICEFRPFAANAANAPVTEALQWMKV